jgi:hypothetical protein
VEAALSWLVLPFMTNITSSNFPFYLFLALSGVFFPSPTLFFKSLWLFAISIPFPVLFLPPNSLPRNVSLWSFSPAPPLSKAHTRLHFPPYLPFLFFLCPPTLYQTPLLMCLRSVQRLTLPWSTDPVHVASTTSTQICTPYRFYFSFLFIYFFLMILVTGI